MGGSTFELLVLSLAAFVVLSLLYPSWRLFVSLDDSAEVFFGGVVVVDDDWISGVISGFRSNIGVSFSEGSGLAVSWKNGVKWRRCEISDYEWEWRFGASCFCVCFDPSFPFSFDSLLDLSVEPSVFETFPLRSDRSSLLSC